MTEKAPEKAPEKEKEKDEEEEKDKKTAAAGAHYVGTVAGKYQWDEKNLKKRDADDDAVGVAIGKYGWSDGKKAVSIYVELGGLDDVPDEAIAVEAGDRKASLTIAAVGTPAKKRKLELSGLYGEVDGVQMARKKGKNTVVLKLKKKNQDESWSKLLGVGAPSSFSSAGSLMKKE